MKIAVISDIHGNHLALSEVMRQVEKEGVKKVLVLGDIVGYYYHPDKVMDILEKWDYIFIKGNHEELLRRMMINEIDGEALKKKYGSGHNFAIAKLDQEKIKYLVSSPEKMRIVIDGWNILMSHGSPWNADLYLYPDTEKKVLELIDEVDLDIVLIGHSHYQFLYKGKNTILANPGSVGQSRTTGGMADWMVFNTDNGVIQLRSTPYDTREIVREVTETDPENEYLRNVLIRNRN